MATITKREGKRGVTYEVQIRLSKKKSTYQSFKKLTDAKRWAEKTEAEVRANRYGLIAESQKRTFKDAVERYRKTVLPEVKKSRREHIVDRLEQEFGQLALCEVTPALISEYKDRLLHDGSRGKKLSPASIVKILAILSHIFSMCVNEWQWVENNPVAKVSKPSLPRGRTRFLDDNERIALIRACESSQNPYIHTIVILAISTGMRRSEILNLTWNDVDLERARLVLRSTKNGEVRIIALEGLALQKIKELESKRRIDSFLLFPGTDPKKSIDFRSAWRVVIKNAGLMDKDLKFHDLRHSFASYCLMDGAKLEDLMAILGHKSYQLSARYGHLSDAYKRNVIKSMNEKIFG